MVTILLNQRGINIYKKRKKHQINSEVEYTTVLEEFLENNSDCAKTLLSYGIGTNNKDLSDKELLLSYNLKLFLNGTLQEKEVNSN